MHARFGVIKSRTEFLTRIPKFLDSHIIYMLHLLCGCSKTDNVHQKKRTNSQVGGSCATMPPVAELKLLIESLVKENHVMIFSKSYCPYCEKVKELFQSLNVTYKAFELDLEANGQAIQNALLEETGQKTVPNVFVNGVHIGGADATLKAHSEGRLFKTTQNGPVTYDFDLLVVGGGSGGLACSKEAAKQGANVAVCDFVKPSPQGSSWGLGGTCVNVGCIPKKLMHQAALLGESLHDARKFGWEFSEEVKHNWDTMRNGIQDYIGSLNWGYRVQLRERKVKYFNKYAEFIDEHTVKLTDKKGKSETVTSKYFVLATGERPRFPAIPGAKEYCITSDDLFSLGYFPGKTLVIGASYVALECAGFLKGIGFDVTIMVRSIFLRGFDQEMASKVGEYMENHGIKMLKGYVPTKVEQIEAPSDGKPGKVKVFYKKVDGDEETSDEFNTVLLGIGRDACTSGFGLDKVGVQLNSKNGKVYSDDNDRTNVSHIYAIGDILDGKPELTPVAIQAGRLLAKRLFGGSTEKCDYVNIPTTVFTPLEYGCCGYSEEDAITKFQEENIEVYHTNHWPLEFTVAGRENNACYAKLVCNTADNNRVVGFHYLGPNAGEVTQGFGIGMKMKATKEDFDRLIGIHPTTAEVFTTLEITRRSGLSVEASGC